MAHGASDRPQKTFGKFQAPRVELPDLVLHQRESFDWFIKEGIKGLLDEFSPISDYSAKKFELSIDGFEVGEPKHNERHARENMLTYEAPMKVTMRLTNKTLGSEKTQDIFLADLPMMTPHGSFVVSGVERVIVPQLARSFGVFFTTELYRGKQYFGAKLIPARGAWVEIESDPDGAIYVKIDRKRKFPITGLLRIFGLVEDDKILAKFAKSPAAATAITETLKHDTSKTLEASYMEIHRRLRDGDLATPENARAYVDSIFSGDRYDLSRVGRYRINHRFGLPLTEKALAERTVTVDDLIRIITTIAESNEDPNATADDIDHLGFRRVRFVGELLQQRMRVGMARMKRNIKDSISTIE